MFSTAGAAAQGSAVNNPFAVKPNTSSSAPGNPFGSGGAAKPGGPKQNKRSGRSPAPGDSESNQKKAANPFSKKRNHRGSDASESDRSQGKKGARGNQAGTRKTNGPNGQKNSRKQLPQPYRENNGAGGDASDASRPTSSSSASSVDSGAAQTVPSAMINSTDPHTRNVYTQLRKDGISPPSWPSRPGDPSNSAAMSKFRERYESYRVKVRKSLTKAGLIDDPNKRRALKDAIEFRGISQDMCPEFEKIQRITELDVHQPEKSPKNNLATPSRMVKKLARSAAGQEAPLPMDVRSVPTLRRTLDYLIEDLLQHDGNLPTLHGFLWDRTRAIRRDFTFFSTLTPDEIKSQVYVLENIARFHVTSLHLLSKKSNRPEEFVEQQELEQLGKTLLSLRDLYDDCNAQDIVCENEPEFRAFYLIFHARDPNIMETLQRSWKPELWRNSDDVRTAVSLVEALQNTRDFHGPLKDGPSLAASGAHHAYFRIVADSSISYTMACFAECHFPLVRRSILSSIARALGRPKDEVKDVTAATLNRWLRFDTVDEAIEFAELHGLEFEADPSNPSDLSRRRLILRHRQQLPHVRLTHQFSQNLVEKKRGSHSLPDVIHKTIHQGDSAPQADSLAAKDGLFVSSPEPEAPQTSAATQPPQLKNPFAMSEKPTPNFGGGFSSGPAEPSTAQANNPFAPSTGQTPPAANPFASATKSSAPAFGVPAQPAPAASGTPSLSSFGALTAQKDNKDSQAKSADEPKPNPFAGMFQPKADNATPMTTGGMMAPPQPPTKSTAPAGTADTDKAKTTPSFSFPQPAAPPQQPTSTGLSAPAASTPPGQFSPAPSSLSGFKSTPSTSMPPPALPDTSKSTVKQPAADKGLSPSLLPPSLSGGKQTTANTGGFSFGTAAPPPPASAKTTMPSPKQADIVTQPAEPRDRMGDFTKWFVNGDHGLMEDFGVYMVDEILKGVYDDFVEKEKERKRLEEEARINHEVETFRVYNLRVKFFYRWKKNARTKRLRSLRKSGREQFRAYYAAKRQEEKEAAARLAEEKARLSRADHSKEVTDFINRRKSRRSNEEEKLLNSGVLTGVGNERQHAARIVSRDRQSSISRPTSRASSIATSIGPSSRRSGGKTQALRDQFINKKQEGFRSSMPPMDSRSTAGSEVSRAPSNVSERWRLKAMGIVQMPDGTALPENMANDILYGGKSYPGLKVRPRASSYSMSERRLHTPTTIPRPERNSLLSRSYGANDSPTPATTNKRKRPEDEDAVESVAEDDAGSPTKRPMSEAQKLISELRAMRVELEEGASWYRSQTERLQSEIGSRGTTPWDESI